MKSVKLAVAALAAVTLITGTANACHHHRAARTVMYLAPQPVFMPAPVMIYNAPAPMIYHAPAVQYAPVMQAAPIIEAAPIVEEAAYVEAAPAMEVAPVEEAAVVEEAAPVEVGIEQAAPMIESAPMIEDAGVEMAPSNVTPGVMNPVNDLAPYFYSLEAPLTQQPYAPTAVATPVYSAPVYNTSFVQPASFFVPAAPAPRRCLHGGCH